MEENKLRNLVKQMIAEALIDPKETAMVKVKRKDAFDRAAGLWKQLSFHFIKIVMYGDKQHWRKEIIAFSESLDSIELKLKSRSKLTREEHLDAMSDFRETDWGKKYFFNAFQVVSHDLGKPKRSLEEAQEIVYELQKVFLDSFTSKSKKNFNSLIDSVLSKYKRV